VSAGGRRWPYTTALAAVAVAFVLPLLWLFSVSLKTKAGVRVQESEPADEPVDRHEEHDRRDHLQGEKGGEQG
jgi:ABC-type glycerol-3-phosphate transport system permease component